MTAQRFLPHKKKKKKKGVGDSQLHKPNYLSFIPKGSFFSLVEKITSEKKMDSDRYKKTPVRKED